MTATWDRTWLTPEQRAERLAAAPPGGDLPPGRFVRADDGSERDAGDPGHARWQSYADGGDRAAAIRRIIALAETPDEEVRAEHDLMLLGVNPVELFFAAGDPTPDDYR
jgi:hypothetical protein